MKWLSLTSVIASLLTGVLARSSVYVVSNNVHELTTPHEISMNAFSMFYSHMTGSSSNHPVLKLQSQDALQDMVALLPSSNSVFEQKVDANLVVIIAGVQNPEDILSVDTSFYVNNDNPDSYATVIEENMENEDITTYKNQKIEVKKGNSIQEASLAVSAENFQHDFSKFNTELFDSNIQVDKDFMIDLESIKELSQTKNTVIQVTSLQKLAQAYGTESDKYREGQGMMKDLLETLVIPNFQKSFARSVSTFIITPVGHTHQKRAAPEEGACFRTAKACRNATASCSGHGQCVMVDDCYTCQCQASSYVGDSCQYVNAVNDFQLLFWTSVLLIVVTTSVVVCVYQSGSSTDTGIMLTQSLPKQE